MFMTNNLYITMSTSIASQLCHYNYSQIIENVQISDIYI